MNTLLSRFHSRDHFGVRTPALLRQFQCGFFLSSAQKVAISPEPNEKAHLFVNHRQEKIVAIPGPVYHIDTLPAAGLMDRADRTQNPVVFPDKRRGQG